MTDFKHGDWVVADLYGHKNVLCRISIDEDKCISIAQNICGHANYYNDEYFGFKYLLCTYNLFEDQKEFKTLNIRPVDENIENVWEGAVIRDEDGFKRKVLAICGKMIFISQEDDKNVCTRYNPISFFRIMGFKIDLEASGVSKRDDELDDVTKEAMLTLKKQGYKVIKEER